MVSGGGLRLIDYDGMFVPGMTQGQGAEVGHKHFQHPGRTVRLFGPKMDRFSFIVLDVSLEAVAVDPSLHRRFREGGQAIIFKANDFSDPSSSEVFRILAGMPAVRDSAKKLAAICAAPVTDVPTLSDFRAGRNIPTPAATPVGASPRPAPAPVYIGAFEVIDAKDFNAVLKRVGDKIELVGKITSVKQGTAKRNKGPYVFLNFGSTGHNSVKVTIWSEALGNMSARPSQAWVGKWISVTGLIELFERQYYGKPYRNLGITLTSNSQIIQINEQEAKFRLGLGMPQWSGSRHNGNVSNDDILRGLRGNAGRSEPNTRTTSATPVSPSNLPRTPTARNDHILRSLKRSGAPTPSTGYSPTPMSRAGINSAWSKWLWRIAAIAAAALAWYVFVGPQTRSSYRPPPAPAYLPTNQSSYQASTRPVQHSDTQTTSSLQPTAPLASQSDATLDHGPRRVACDAQWGTFHKQNLPSYEDFLRNCLSHGPQ